MLYYLHNLSQYCFHYHSRPDGSVTISTKVPDTITSWTASAFSVNPLTGLGIAEKPAKVGIVTFMRIDLIVLVNNHKGAQTWLSTVYLFI